MQMNHERTRMDTKTLRVLMADGQWLMVFAFGFQL